MHAIVPPLLPQPLTITLSCVCCFSAAEHCTVPGTMMRHGITVCLYFVPPHRVKPIDW
jgi:hypothetical protein